MKTLLSILFLPLALLAQRPQQMLLNKPAVATSSGPDTRTNILNGLFAWYFTNGASGTDQSGNGNTATLYDSPGSSAGQTGNGISLNGSTQAGETVNTYLMFANASTQGSAVAWFNATTFNSGLIAYEADTGVNNFNMQTPGAPTDTFHFNLGSGTDYPGVKTNFQTGTWYLVGITWNGSHVIVYVDGAVDIDYTSSAKPNQTPNFGTDGTQFGRYSFNNHAFTGQYFGGVINSLRFYNRPLTSAEINYLHTNGKY